MIKKPTILGKIVYLVFYYPKNNIVKIVKKGVLNTLAERYGVWHMARSASKLKVDSTHFDSVTQQEFPVVYFVTGKNYWYQTAFCLYSLLIHLKQKIQITIIDDGTLTHKQMGLLMSIYDNIVLLTHKEIEEKIDKLLPRKTYPVLRERRDSYPHLKKLTDVHVGNSGWNVVFDSDMLFYRDPKAFSEWLKKPQHPCHLVDIETSYGYPLEYLQTFISEVLREKVNVGILGLKSEAINWNVVEYWSEEMIRIHGTHYTQEQALGALLCSEYQSENDDDHDFALPLDDYIVCPEMGEARKPQAVMHHFVADSKSTYLRYAWKNILSRSL